MERHKKDGVEVKNMRHAKEIEEMAMKLGEESSDGTIIRAEDVWKWIISHHGADDRTLRAWWLRFLADPRVGSRPLVTVDEVVRHGVRALGRLKLVVFQEG